MRYVIIIVLIISFSCNYTNHQGKRTRIFKLTEDSTFIGAWGGVLKNYPSFPDNDFHLVFIYTKNNKIYVPEKPKYYDSTKDEKEMLNTYFSFLNEQIGEYSWNDNYIVENESQISEYTKLKSGHRYIIDDSNNLIYSTIRFDKKYKGEDTFNFVYYKFKPYNFKSMRTAENK